MHVVHNPPEPPHVSAKALYAIELGLEQLKLTQHCFEQCSLPNIHTRTTYTFKVYFALIYFPFVLLQDDSTPLAPSNERKSGTREV
jgi:hypothetical protein